MSKGPFIIWAMFHREQAHTMPRSEQSIVIGVIAIRIRNGPGNPAYRNCDGGMVPQFSHRLSDILPEVNYINIKRFFTLWGNPADSQRVIVPELFQDINITGVF